MSGQFTVLDINLADWGRCAHRALELMYPSFRNAPSEKSMEEKVSLLLTHEASSRVSFKMALTALSHLFGHGSWVAVHDELRDRDGMFFFGDGRQTDFMASRETGTPEVA
jgi:hypothetical protein